MVFKNFRVQVIVRVILLTLGAGMLVWCLTHALYLRSIYAFLALIIMVVEFIWYADRFNRDIKTFMLSLLQRDFTTHFQSQGRSKSFDELYDTLNTISGVFRNISAEKEAQFRFLEMLVEHVRVGILSVDEKEKIRLANQALKDLVRKDVLFSLRSLESFDISLAENIREISSGETRLVKVRAQNEILHLSMHAAEFRMENQNHKLISIQNITTELEAREMEAWQKLIRVLTHEIMNSVSPVISLSETLQGRVNEHREALNLHPELYTSLEAGLDAIHARSKGLYNFTQSYRKLTGTPKLEVKETNTRALIARVMILMEKQVEAQGIRIEISSPDIPVVLDPGLMEQVLINLLLNAMAAVREKPDPAIQVGAIRNAKGQVTIYVRDNGEGMDEITAEKVFIPFFTTRKNGSGIGLALTKQILHLHRADIHFHSVKGVGTEFVIVL